MANIIPRLADFVVQTSAEDIPREAVEEAKRIIIDSIGCALAALHTEKGKICISFANKVGGPMQATAIGLKTKTGAPLASFINAELFNTLDFDVLFHPFGHITPYVLSPAIALGEVEEVSGQSLVAAVILAHEVAQRVASGLVISDKFSKTLRRDLPKIQLPIHGYGMAIIGAVAGASKVMGLSREQTEDAMGIAGYCCPVPGILKFTETVPCSMTKFSPAGWISEAAVNACLLAKEGYAGDRKLFEGEFGFWKMFGAQGWNHEYVLKGLGELWYMAEGMMGYKRYPCCGALHGSIDILQSIIKQFSIRPQDVIEVNVVLNLLAELPLWKNDKINSQIEAQFSARYIISVACHQIEAGYKWQVPETYTDPAILEFMKKVNIITPISAAYKRTKSIVELVTLQRKTGQRVTYTEKDISPVSFDMTDEEIIDKFRHNAKGFLSRIQVESIIDSVMALEDIVNICEIMNLLTPSLS